MPYWGRASPTRSAPRRRFRRPRPIDPWRAMQAGRPAHRGAAAWAPEWPHPETALACWTGTATAPGVSRRRVAPGHWPTSARCTCPGLEARRRLTADYVAAVAGGAVVPPQERPCTTIITLCTGNAAAGDVAGAVLVAADPDLEVITAGTHVIDGQPSELAHPGGARRPGFWRPNHHRSAQLRPPTSSGPT